MRDLSMVDNDPLLAKSNKKLKDQTNNKIKASGRKGKSVTGKGKKLRKCWNCQLLSHLLMQIRWKIEIHYKYKVRISSCYSF